MPRRKRTSKRKADLHPLDRMNAKFCVPYEPFDEPRARLWARMWAVMRDEFIEQARTDPDHWSFNVFELQQLPRECRTMDYDDPRALDGDYAGGEVIPWTSHDERMMRVALKEYRRLQEAE